MLLSFCHTLLHISVNIIACGESILQNFYYYNFYLFIIYFFIIIIICMNIFLSIFVLECFIMPNRTFFFICLLYNEYSYLCGRVDPLIYGRNPFRDK